MISMNGYINPYNKLLHSPDVDYERLTEMFADWYPGMDWGEAVDLLDRMDFALRPEMLRMVTELTELTAGI